jgi:hypothetical protein
MCGVAPGVCHGQIGAFLGLEGGAVKLAAQAKTDHHSTEVCSR